MRHIRLPKESEAPQSFQRWKKRHPQANYGRFKDADVKRELKNSYIQRQGGLCCYCESRIGMETSHIEHIDPQMGGLSTHSMEYANMAASCIKDPKKESLLFSEGTPLNVIGDSLLHCGHARGTNRVVSPYDPRCETFFSYSSNGEIKVNPNLENAEARALAYDSIQFLRLNVPTLVVLRKVAFTETIKMLQRGISENDILRDINGKSPPFISSAKTAIKLWNKIKEGK